jgi:subtilase family serine protease
VTPLTVVSGNAGFAPADIYSFYSENPLMNAGFNGAGQSIAIVGLSDFLTAAVTTFETQFSLPTAVISSILVDNNSDPGTNGNETEALLDLEWAHAVAPAAAINFYVADVNHESSNGAVFDAIQRAVSDDTCGTISVTFSVCGFPLQFYENTLDPVLNMARMQGQQVFIASGDFGAAPPVPQGSTCIAGTTVGVSELAADPNAISVGGSQPTAIPTTGTVAGFTPEQVFNTTGGIPALAGGGGVSQAFSKPNYQLGLTPNDGQRDIPDISLFAALTFTNATFSGVFIGQDQSGVGAITCCQIGTSIAAPLWAGVGAVMEQAARNEDQLEL